MVSLKSMGSNLPKLETTLITANTVLNGSGGAGWSAQSIANIIARVTGPFNSGGFSSSQPQTVVGSPGFKFQLKPELVTGIGLLIADYALGEIKFSFPAKSIIRKYVLKPVGQGLLAGGIINVVLGDPSPTNVGFVGSSAGRVAGVASLARVGAPSLRGY